jgi:subtilisin family serine protease
MPIPLPPGHVRVLIEAKQDSYLVDLAMAQLTGTELPDMLQRFNDYIAKANFVFDWLNIDPAFAIPVGLGGSDRTKNLPDNLHPQKSDRFLIRGSIDANRLRPEINDGTVYSDPIIGSMRMRGINRPVGCTADVHRQLNTEALWDNGLDGSGVAIAIMDSGIYLPRLAKQRADDLREGVCNARFNDLLSRDPEKLVDRESSWRPDELVTQPGEHRLGHGTMCAYDALIAAPNATLIDLPMLLARATGDHKVPATVSSAIHAYSHLVNVWFNKQPRPNYTALVVSNSWGIFNPSLDEFPKDDPGRFIDNPNHIFRLLIGALTGTELDPPVDGTEVDPRKNVDVIFCGSNCGPECTSPACLLQTTGMIMGANAYPEVLTVGGCDAENDVIGYSSRGPAISMFTQSEVLAKPQIEQKPDISAYTHFLGSKILRNYLPDSGVSAACPVAAGCVAALRTKLSPAKTPPNKLFDTIKQTARGGNKAGPGGTWNKDFGNGIIDPVEAARRLGLIA